MFACSLLPTDFQKRHECISRSILNSHYITGSDVWLNGCHYCKQHEIILKERKRYCTSYFEIIFFIEFEILLYTKKQIKQLKEWVTSAGGRIMKTTICLCSLTQRLSKIVTIFYAILLIMKFNQRCILESIQHTEH